MQQHANLNTQNHFHGKTTNIHENGEYNALVPKVLAHIFYNRDKVLCQSDIYPITAPGRSELCQGLLL